MTLSCSGAEIPEFGLRTKCKALTWQELNVFLPPGLRNFLDLKYGIVAPGRSRPILVMNSEKSRSSPAWGMVLDRFRMALNEFLTGRWSQSTPTELKHAASH